MEENKIVEEIIDEESVRKAYINVILLRNNIKNQKDCFKFLASANLLNSYVKKDYAIEEIKKSYTFKNIISEVIEDIIINNISGVHMYYTKQVVYIEVNGYQFSFHNVKETDIIREYKYSRKNIKQEWKEIRLQQIAVSIFNKAV
ncbi:hypothetical protein [Clostridium sp. 1001271B_151109_B4]|uniref:hypothetical protein n=1 Tax=Clostridium sp. 1001271B_151109_B4 TaxID=2787148 RepID=UPI0018AA947F|nr:hypothetical protein [Clostridium sp. 1001271B_151109_B4]